MKPLITKQADGQQVPGDPHLQEASSHSRPLLETQTVPSRTQVPVASRQGSQSSGPREPGTRMPGESRGQGFLGTWMAQRKPHRSRTRVDSDGRKCGGGWDGRWSQGPDRPKELYGTGAGPRCPSIPRTGCGTRKNMPNVSVTTWVRAGTDGWTDRWKDRRTR